jgi:uncharacterized phosphosugar-binding protein
MFFNLKEFPMTTNKFMFEFAKVLEKIGETQSENISKAATWIAEAIMADHNVFMFGSGHSAIPTFEVFPRLGSFPGWVPIHELATSYCSSLSGDLGFRQTLFLEKVPGYAKVILDNYVLDPKDIMVLVSNSGCNANVVEMAEEAYTKGLKTIAVTSVVHSTPLKSYAPSGKKLMEVCDLVLDTCNPRGDALVEVPFLRANVAAGSTLAATYILQSVVAETAEIFAEHKYSIPVIPYPNDKMSAEETRKMMDQFYVENARRCQKIYR